MQDLKSKFAEGLKAAERETGETFDFEFVSYERGTSDSTHFDMCEKVSVN